MWYSSMSDIGISSAEDSIPLQAASLEAGQFPPGHRYSKSSHLGKVGTHVHNFRGIVFFPL